MQEADELTRCPDCGHQIRIDRRYVTWCDKCEWNLDPTHTPNQTPPWRLKLEHRLAESLYGELLEGNVHRAGWKAARIAAHLLSVLILLLPLVALVTGVYLLIFLRPLWFSIPLVVLALAVAFLLRPRLLSLPSRSELVPRANAPALYAVLDQLADAVGTRRVTVAVDTHANLWYGQIGWRFRPVVGIGLPLWVGLQPQERVAILAHELGHGRHGDLLSGWLIGNAQGVLAELRHTFRPGHLERIRRAAGWRDGSGAGLFGRIFNATIGAMAGITGWVLDRLALRSSQRNEYLADRAAGEIAGSEAMAQALERTLLADTSYDAMLRALRFPAGIEPLDAVRRTVTEVPKREIDRRLRASRIRETRTDATHPPTYLRAKLIRTRPSTAARVVLGTNESRNIDQELIPTAERLLRRLRAEF
ncbi:M48 family metalloprotease [Kribbella sp. NPDC055071]